MDNKEKTEVRDFSCKRYRENRLLSSIADKMKQREREKAERERRRRDKEMSDLQRDIADLM
jgi:prophage tail gpP-like protein